MRSVAADLCWWRRTNHSEHSMSFLLSVVAREVQLIKEDAVPLGGILKHLIVVDHFKINAVRLVETVIGLIVWRLQSVQVGQDRR